jgi:hypothetical protein
MWLLNDIESSPAFPVWNVTYETEILPFEGRAELSFVIDYQTIDSWIFRRRRALVWIRGCFLDRRGRNI